MQNKRFSFSGNVWLKPRIFAVCTIAFFVCTCPEKQIDRANDLRHQSCLIANELRQSSDYLTIMASVVTGNPA